MYRVVIRNMAKPDERITFQEYHDRKSALAALRRIGKLKWDMDRRPEMGVIDHIVLKIENCE